MLVKTLVYYPVMTNQTDTGNSDSRTLIAACARAHRHAVLGLAHAQRFEASRRPGDLSEDDEAEWPVHGLNA